MTSDKNLSAPNGLSLQDQNASSAATVVEVPYSSAPSPVSHTESDGTALESRVTLIDEQKRWWELNPFPRIETPHNIATLEELLDQPLSKKIPMSIWTERLALESEPNSATEEAWRTIFTSSAGADMLLGMTAIGAPSFNSRLNSKQNSENDCQIVVDSLIRETIFRLNEFQELGYFSRNLTHQCAISSNLAEPSRSSAIGGTRPDFQCIYAHVPERKLDSPQILLIEEKEGGGRNGLAAARKDLENPLRFKWSALHYGDVPFIVALAVAGTKVQWLRITYMDDHDVAHANHKDGSGYPLRAFHSHKVESVGPVMEALNTIDRIRIVRWTINWVFLAHSMVTKLPAFGLNKIMDDITKSGKDMKFNTTLGFVRKTVNADLVDLEALQRLYKIIEERGANANTVGDIKHIIRHTPEIKKPQLDKRGDFLKDESGEILWITQKLIKAKRIGEEDTVKTVPPETLAGPFLQKSPLGDTVIVSLTPLGAARFPNSNLEVKEALRAILSALRFMHGIRFVHRDLRWPNLMRLSDGTWMLLDLEIATDFGQLWPSEAVLKSKFWPGQENVWRSTHDLKMVANMLDDVNGKTWLDFKPIQETLRKPTATAEDALEALEKLEFDEISFEEADDAEVPDDGTNGISASLAGIALSSGAVSSGDNI